MFVWKSFRSDKHLSSYARVAIKVHVETHVGLHVKRSLFLFDYNQIWNVSTNSSIV
jgi:hypothetical protein